MLSDSFYAMVSYLQEMTTIAQNISQGNLSHTITPRSERDMLGHAFSQMVNYLHEMSAMASAIAQGNLAMKIAVRSEFDAFGQSIQTMMSGLQGLVQQIKTISVQIAETGTNLVSLTSKDVEIVQQVQDSVDDMVSTIIQMRHSVKEVAQNMDLLSYAVEGTLAAVSEVTSSISSIALNTEDLTDHTHNTANELQHAMQMLGDVAEQTSLSRQLSQETMHNALEGQQAVEQVRESMDRIQHTNQDAEETIIRFAAHSKEIDTILDVIYGVTEQSALLALNASIIAAQAGIHGRGFSVIAEEMRNLAHEVEASTKNIAAIVRTLQQETSMVVQMIHDGTTKIEEGVARTQQAQQSLETIISSARRSSEVVSQIADALQTQMTTSYSVMDTMAHLHTMTTEITRATNEQKLTMIHIQEAVDHISELATLTHRATKEQLEGAQQVLKAADAVRMLNDQSLESSADVNRATTTADLATQAESLLLSIDRFQL